MASAATEVIPMDRIFGTRHPKPCNKISFRADTQGQDPYSTLSTSATVFISTGSLVLSHTLDHFHPPVYAQMDGTWGVVRCCMTQHFSRSLTYFMPSNPASGFTQKTPDTWQEEYLSCVCYLVPFVGCPPSLGRFLSREAIHRVLFQVPTLTAGVGLNVAPQLPPFTCNV